MSRPFSVTKCNKAPTSQLTLGGSRLCAFVSAPVLFKTALSLTQHNSQTGKYLKLGLRAGTEVADEEAHVLNAQQVRAHGHKARRWSKVTKVNRRQVGNTRQQLRRERTYLKFQIERGSDVEMANDGPIEQRGAHIRRTT